MPAPGEGSNAAEALTDPDPIRVSVHSRDAAMTESIVRRYTSAYEVSKTNGKVTFLIANPDGLSMDEIRSRPTSHGPRGRGHQARRVRHAVTGYVVPASASAEAGTRHRAVCCPTRFP